MEKLSSPILHNPSLVDSPEPATHNPYLVGIGASAGGLDALQTFFRQLPDDCQLSFIVVQHLSPHHESHMEEILERETKLPVRFARNQMPIVPGGIYLNPPGKILTVSRGKFVLRTMPREGKVVYPIDQFFQSLAKESGHKAIGMIFSGTGTDGTNGIKTIKSVGGLVMVQDPSTARFDGMPKSAIATGFAEYILSPERMAKRVLIYSFIKQNTFSAEKGLLEEKDVLAQIHIRLEKVTGIHFSNYKPTLVNRRIEQRARLNQLETPLQYLNLLYQSEEETEKLKSEILVSVTHFFRDQEAYTYLRNKIIPTVFETTQNEEIRIWVPGCSTGEEAYSLAIMFYEYAETHDIKTRIKIFASDINRELIEFAGKALYPKGIVADIPAQYLAPYFSPKPNGYQVKKVIRDMVIFTAHDITKDPPFNRLDLISCRNLLIFFKEGIQKRIFTLLNFALRKKGHLLLGHGEFSEDYLNIFKPINRKHLVFQAVNNPNLFNSKEYLRFRKGIMERAVSPVEGVKARNHFQNQLLELTNNLLVEEFISGCLVINEEFELIKYFGKANHYLKVPTEPRDWNILRMVSLDTAAAIRSGVRECLSQNQSVHYRALDFGNGYHSAKVNLTIRKQDLVDDPHKNLIFIILKEVVSEDDSQNPSIDIDFEQIKNDRIAELEQDLKLTRSNLQASIEELQSSNEELMTTNEELQTMNEELQSVNEELYTINAEYQANLAKLSEVSANLDNLIRESGIGLLFLDHNMNIKRFTPAVTQYFNITQLDISRPIEHFSTNFMGDEFLADLQAVQEDRITIKRELMSQEGNWYRMEIMHYQSEEEDKTGILITVVDISDLKGVAHFKKLTEKYQELKSELEAGKEKKKETQTALEEYESLLKYGPELVIELDKEGIKTIPIQNGALQLEDIPAVFDWLTDAHLSELTQTLLPRMQQVQSMQKSEHFLEKISFSGQEHHLEIQLLPMERDSVMAMLKDRSFVYQQIQRKDQLESHMRQMVDMLPDISVCFYNQALFPEFYEGEMGKLFEGKGSILEIFDEKKYPNAEKAINGVFNGQHQSFEFQQGQDQLLAFVYPMEEAESVDNTGVLILQKVTDLNLMTRELQNRLSEMEQFAYAVSHDLKSPLRSIAGFAQLLERRYKNQLDQDASEYIQFIVQYVHDMRELINGLLHFSLVGTVEEEDQWLDTRSLVENVVSGLKADIDQKAVSVQIGALPKLKGQEVLLKQVFQNLIENGIKFSEDSGNQIDIQASKEGENWVFSIQDQGIGIPEKYQHQIFTIFKHLNNKKDYKGNGIGLALCKKIIERMGGKIWVKSKEGEGATFYLVIPEAKME